MISFIKPHAVSVFIVRKTSEEPRYLLIRRCGKYLPGTWQMVTGRIEEGETAAQAAMREIREETGLEVTKLYTADAVETFYMQSIDMIAFVPVFVAFVEEMKVQLSPTEHDAYEWLPFEQARQRLAWAEQQRVITQVHEMSVLKVPIDLHIADRNNRPQAKAKSTLSRTGVYGISLENGKILLVKQKKGPHSGKFDLPGGGIEAGETVEEALRREFSEEVGMTFNTMKLKRNVSANTEGRKGDGTPFLMHQIGLIYEVKGLSPIQNKIAEMEYFWMELPNLSKTCISPLVEQILDLI